jgi:hypothetical protein
VVDDEGGKRGLLFTHVFDLPQLAAYNEAPLPLEYMFRLTTAKGELHSDDYTLDSDRNCPRKIIIQSFFTTVVILHSN